ncbi:hypothetical protein GCM10011515_08910 [Tsuneonella deserti]|uniref:Uncharacterized protein n=2 Tax=Tsuneonella deserti TaxID=2035528 RepID=A0ABQ1S2W2_9SPHN|nr:hypothetical protein GCM10011515_08910 [Tsuneonella deserti]
MSPVDKWWAYHFGREITPGERLRVLRFARTLGAKNPLFMLVASVIYSTTETLKADEQALLRIGPSVGELLNNISRVVSSASHSAAMAAQSAMAATEEVARAEATLVAAYTLMQERSDRQASIWWQLRRRGLELTATFALAFLGSYLAIKVASPTASPLANTQQSGEAFEVNSTGRWNNVPTAIETSEPDTSPDLDR